MEYGRCKPFMKFFFITNSPDLAQFGVENGVDRIFIDLEFLGKQKRQGHLDTVISRHNLSDIDKLRPIVPTGQLLVRINPIHDHSAEEIERVIQAGADILMLPMFRSPHEVEIFSRCVAGRARTSLLVETIGAMQSLQECVRVPGIDEVHIGLNDLHLELDNRFMFEPLANGLVDRMAAILKSAAIPFGFGGIARIGEGLLPAEQILAEHARLGSTAVILSRTFHRQATSPAEIRKQMSFNQEINQLRAVYTAHCHSNPDLLEQNRVEIGERIRQIAANLAPREMVVRG